MPPELDGKMRRMDERYAPVLRDSAVGGNGDLPHPEDRPRERLTRCGVEGLRDDELLAVVLGTGYRGHGVMQVAREILQLHPKEQLLVMEQEALRKLNGVGRGKAALLVAAFELARRGLQKGLGVLLTISCPADAVPLLSEIRDQRKEHFLCLYPNARNQVIHKEVISIGSLSASIVHPREVFQVAISRSAASILLAHNHPSGDPTPSREDLELTRRLMGIDIIDHIILCEADFFSLKEQSLL